MFAEFLLASVLQLGPFAQKGPGDFTAIRPFWSRQGEVTDVLWPVFTHHRDWWRFCYFMSCQEGQDDAFQFEVIPLWFNGRTRTGEDYWGLFPLWGRHPHILLVYDWEFCLWPLWMRYRMPRPSTKEWLTSTVVLFPFVSWRSDGSWGVWPLCGLNHRRESDHRYALWPLVTWADYRADRDTAGAGSSWMFWPLYGEVRRERERQTLVLPPLFSYAETPQGWRGRFPWPLVEIERFADRDRTSVFPFWEHTVDKSFRDGGKESEVTRFGWKLVELYDDETRVFPFWVSRRDDSYFRLWPFYEKMNLDRAGDFTWCGSLALFPIRWVDPVDRNWASFWTLYESVESPVFTDHSLFWGLITWRTFKD